MLYELYVNKMKKLAAVKNAIVMAIVGMLAVAAVGVLLLSGFLLTKGIIFGGVKGESEYVYGDTVSFEKPGALFSGVVLQYSPDGVEWTEEVPFAAGEYFVRAESNKSFGFKGHSKSFAFTIKKKELSLALADTTVQWRATPELDTVGLVGGDRLDFVNITLSNDGLGEAEATIHASSVKIIKESNGADVSDCYNVSATGGLVTVVAREITVGVETVEKQYDGKLIEPTLKVIAGSFAEGHTPIPEFSATTLINVGEEKVSISSPLKIFEGDTDVSGGYYVTYAEGTHRVIPRELTVTVDAQSKVYDGMPLEVREPYCSGGTSTAEGESLSIDTYGEEMVTVGAVLDYIRSVKVVKGGEETTDNYSITVVNGRLEVTVRPVSLSTDHKTELYNGKPITDSREPVAEKMAEEHTVLVTNRAEMTDAGEYENFVTYKILNSLGEDVTYCHAVSESFGKLNIEKRKITVTVMTPDNEGGSKMYDGKPIKISMSFGGDGAAEGQSFLYETNGSVVSVWQSVDRYITAYDVTVDATGESVLRNYDVTVKDTKLVVTQRDITVTVVTPDNPDGRKEYDGKPIFVDIRLSRETAEGEMLVFGRAGEIVNVSESVYDGYIKSISLIYTESGNPADMRNYSITVENKNVIITPRVVTLTAVATAKLYDGTPLKVTILESKPAAEGESYQPIINSKHLSIINVKDAVGVDAYITGCTVIKNATGEQVEAENYSFTFKNDVLKVDPKPVLVTVSTPENADGTKEYDGKPIGVVVSIGEAAPGERIDMEFDVPDSGYIVNVWESTANMYVKEETLRVVYSSGVTSYDTSNYDITVNNMKISITPRKVTLTAVASNNGKVYDASPLNISVLYDKAAAEGESYAFTLSTILNVRESVEENEYDFSCTVVNGSNDNYKFTYLNDRLYIKPRPVKITVSAPDNGKYYDGLVMDVSVSWEAQSKDRGKLNAHTFEFIYSYNGDFIVPFESKSYVTGIKVNGGAIYSDNYEPEYIGNSLSILKRPVKVIVGSGKTVYDGNPFNVHSYKFGRVDGVAEKNCGVIDADRFEITYGLIDKINAGTYKNSATVDIFDSRGNVVTSTCYEVVIENGTVEIAKRNITITAGPISKDYDGLPAEIYYVAGAKIGDVVNGRVVNCEISEGTLVSQYSHILEVELKEPEKYIKPCKDKAFYIGYDIVGSDYSDIRIRSKLSNYNVTVVYADGVYIEADIVTVYADDITVKYRSEHFTFDEFAVYEDITRENRIYITHNLLDRYSLIIGFAEDESMFLDAGEYRYTLKYSILDENGADVTDNFVFDIIYEDGKDYGSFTIQKLRIILDTEDYSVIYDAADVSVYECVWEKSLELAPDEYLVFDFDRIYRNVKWENGAVASEMYTVIAGVYEDGEDRTHNYIIDIDYTHGTYSYIIINPNTVYIHGVDILNRYYNGKYVTVSECIPNGVRYSVYPEGDEMITATLSQSYKDVGDNLKYEIEIIYTDKNGVELDYDTSGNYIINLTYDPDENGDTKNYGVINIKKKRIVVYVNDFSKTYNGVSCGEEMYNFVDVVESVVSGETLKLYLDGKYVHVNYDTDGNVIPYVFSLEYSIYNSDGSTLGNYDVEINYNHQAADGTGYGLITIYPIEVYATGIEGAKIYDGSPFTLDDLLAEAVTYSQEIPKGESVSVILSGMYKDVCRDGDNNVISYEYLFELVADNDNTLIGDYVLITDYMRGNERGYDKGILTIHPIVIEVSADDYQKIYDGIDCRDQLGAFVYVDYMSELPKGEVFTVALNGYESFVNVLLDYNGDVTYYEYGIVWSIDGGRSSNYEVYVSFTGEAHITVLKRDVTVITPTSSKVYDGEMFVFTDGTVVENIVDFHYFEILLETLSKVGPDVCDPSENVFEIAIFDESDTDVTANYNMDYVYGMLRITRRLILVSTPSASKEYDGTTLSDTDVYISKNSMYDLVPGDILVVLEEKNVPTAGPNLWDANNVRNELTVIVTDEHITNNYEIEYEIGVLTITPRLLKIKTANASKLYDGTPLMAEGYEYYNVLEGHRVDVLEVVVTGKRINVGVANNTAEVLAFRILDAGGNDITSNYAVLIEEGVLKITSTSITLAPYDVEMQYNGQEITGDGAYVADGEFADGEDLLYACVGGSRVDFGITESYVSLAIVKTRFGYMVYANDETGKNAVLNNYVRIDETAPMYIKCNSMYIMIDAYDNVREYVGSVSNTNCEERNEIELDGEVVYLNKYHFYEIIPQKGTISVTKRRVVLTCEDKTATYEPNGKPLQGSYRITSGSMVEGHYLSAVTSGKATEQGVPVTNTIYEGDIAIYSDKSMSLDSDITYQVYDNYEFIIVEGTLLLE